MSDVIRVLIADDHPLVRQGLEVVIGAQPDMELVAQASDGVEAVALRPLAELPRSWKLDDAFWGLLGGMLFHNGQLSASQDASQGSLGAGLAALGIDAGLLDPLRAGVMQGTSALLLLVDAENTRRIAMAIDGMRFTLVQAPLSAVQEQRLRSTFSACAD